MSLLLAAFFALQQPEVRLVERRRYKVGDCVMDVEDRDVWRIAGVDPDYRVQLWDGLWCRVLDAAEVSEYMDSPAFVHIACPGRVDR